MAKPSSEYVWLPHTQVWAKAPEAKRISKQPRSKKRPKTSAAPVPPPLPSSPKIDPTETPAEENGTLERSAAPLQPLEPEGLQACPICAFLCHANSRRHEYTQCVSSQAHNAPDDKNMHVVHLEWANMMPLVFPAGLSEIQEQVAKAVILPCMHVFCLGCLSQWIALKRSCPMCKVSPSPCAFQSMSVPIDVSSNWAGSGPDACLSVPLLLLLRVQRMLAWVLLLVFRQSRLVCRLP